MNWIRAQQVRVAGQKSSSLQGLQKCCCEIFSWNRAWSWPWKMPWNIWWNFTVASFLRKRSSKVPKNVHEKNHAIFQTFCSCKCPISWHFALCRRLSLKGRSDRLRIWVTVGQTPRIRTESLIKKVPEWGLGGFYRKPPLNPSWM